MKRTLLASLLLSLPLFLWLQGDEPVPRDAVETLQTHSELMESIQDKLRQDPNQADLWFQLGQAYLTKQDFSSSLTCFDYAVRLSEKPTANQLSAKATALYYEEKQRMTSEVESLLERALNQDEGNLTALSLIASDHFISFRYAEAIDAWTRMLNSNDPELNRESVINSLNQAKMMLSQ